MRAGALLLLALACQGPTPPDRTAGPDDTGEPLALTASCTLDPDHALHAWCDLLADRPVALQLSAHADAWPDDPEHVEAIDLDLPGTTLRAGLRRLRPATTYAWSVQRPGGSPLAEGTFTTGDLPSSALFDVEASGVVPSTDRLHLSPCHEQGTIVWTAPDGGVVDFIDLEPQRLVGLQASDDGTVLILEEDDVVERDALGRVLRRFAGSDHGYGLHHDLDADADGRIAALFHEQIEVPGEPEPLDTDGFVLFEPDGAPHPPWRLSDHLPPTLSPTRGTDIHHMNSLQLIDGLAIVSVRHQSMVVAVHADPTRPGFGTVAWHLPGDPSVGWDAPALRIEGLPEGEDPFREQHHAVLHPDGLLSLFDNRRPGEPSRGLVFDLDLDAGIATLVHRQELGTHCGYQGGLVRTPEGDWVASCAPRAQATTFRGDAVVGEAKMICTTGPSGIVHRLLPWAGPGR